MAKITSINLLRESQTHYVDTILKWALTTGRFLIIITETIALAAFVYRFTLDRQIVDLKDTIKNNQAIVSLYLDEPKYRNLNERLNFADTVTTETSILSDKTRLLERLVEVAQGKVTYQKVTIGQNSINMDVSASSTNALSAFLTGIKNLGITKSISVNRVENKASNGVILVSITAALRQTETETEKEDIPDANN